MPNSRLQIGSSLPGCTLLRTRVSPTLRLTRFGRRPMAHRRQGESFLHLSRGNAWHEQTQTSTRLPRLEAMQSTANLVRPQAGRWARGSAANLDSDVKHRIPRSSRDQLNKLNDGAVHSRPPDPILLILLSKQTSQRHGRCTEGVRREVICLCGKIVQRGGAPTVLCAPDPHPGRGLLYAFARTCVRMGARSDLSAYLVSSGITHPPSIHHY